MSLFSSLVLRLGHQISNISDTGPPYLPKEEDGPLFENNDYILTVKDQGNHFNLLPLHSISILSVSMYVVHG